MKPQGQVGSDERDNKRVIRWGAIAIAVLLVGALSYNFFSTQRSAEPAGPANSQSSTPSQPPSGSSTTGTQTR